MMLFEYFAHFDINKDFYYFDISNIRYIFADVISDSWWQDAILQMAICFFVLFY